MHGGKKHEGDAWSAGIQGAIINSLQTTGLFSKYVKSVWKQRSTCAHPRKDLTHVAMEVVWLHVSACDTCLQDFGACARVTHPCVICPACSMGCSPGSACFSLHVIPHVFVSCIIKHRQSHSAVRNSAAVDAGNLMLTWKCHTQPMKGDKHARMAGIWIWTERSFYRSLS